MHLNMHVHIYSAHGSTVRNRCLHLSCSGNAWAAFATLCLTTAWQYPALGFLSWEGGHNGFMIREYIDRDKHTQREGGAQQLTSPSSAGDTILRGTMWWRG